jgi:hypothetical protein
LGFFHVKIWALASCNAEDKKNRKNSILVKITRKPLCKSNEKNLLKLFMYFQA